ncbi:DUF1624 domain-containing protein [Homoserinibacter sp. GY 40078]|nr:DUF1624 domain-containing protein [Homoserinibacter sp. GY 40078]
MVIAHLVAVPAWSWSDPATWSGIVSGRSSILFATLAGVSLALMTGGARPVEGQLLREARFRITARALIVWAFGMLLIATRVPVYVILPAYAVLFLLALPLLPMSRRALLALAGVVAAVVAPLWMLLAELPWRDERAWEPLVVATGLWYPFAVWIAFVAIGIAAGRSDLGRLGVQLGLAAAGAVVALTGYGLGAVAVGLPPEWAQILSASAHSGGIGEIVGSGGFAVAVLGVCLLVCRIRVVGTILLPVRAVGAMPLSAYTAHLLAWALWAWLVLGDSSNLGGFRALQPVVPLLIGIVVGCTLWALTLGRGPLERMLALLSRGAGRLSSRRR